jgi:hypothetical protein
MNIPITSMLCTKNILYRHQDTHNLKNENERKNESSRHSDQLLAAVSHKSPSMTTPAIQKDFPKATSSRRE